jgi:hypothetical protein
MSYAFGEPFGHSYAEAGEEYDRPLIHLCDLFSVP